MKLNVLILTLVSSLLFSSCDWLFGQHNEANAQGRNLDSEHIYGEGEPRQLGGEMKGDEEDIERARKIREKLYGEKKEAEKVEPIIVTEEIPTEDEEMEEAVEEIIEED